MSGTSRSNAVPAWDREGDLGQARAQVSGRVTLHTEAAETWGDQFWVAADETPQTQINKIAAMGPKPVVGSDMVLWTWPPAELAGLSTALEETGGILVFLEPTAGLGLRRAAQLAAGRLLRRTRGHDYRRDIPAELRAAGFIVTTQVRLRHRLVGDYVRGEARHFSH
jgi:hypothetical protein